ncbi:MFS transporter (plasmid) [Bartonella sp. HY329]|uniref:MFS transporter n=1 Tax=unclassified Bartonella TaxID=2645622 RepID=UPI0021C87BD0|nr:MULTISPECIES: MFS transporter [unclassified Bartonella]UXM96480.1 MFS transporter [Bartonella sp. HY329]UXN10803.1 MFS transporter [Bartonella sp. HY328]
MFQSIAKSIAPTDAPTNAPYGQRRLRYLCYGAFYIVTAIPMSYIFYLLPALLREAGYSAASISLLSLVYLPYALRVFWAPLIDRYAKGAPNAYRHIILLTALIATFTLLAFLWVDPSANFALLMVLSSLLFIILATGTIALDGFAVITEDEQGYRYASIWQVIGFTIGGIILGLIAFFANGQSWFIILSAIIICTALATGFLFLVIPARPALERFPKSVKRFSDKKRGVNKGLERRSDPIRSKSALTIELNNPKDAKSHGETRSFLAFLAFLRHKAIWHFILIALFAKMGLGLVTAYLPIMQVDFGVSAGLAGFFGAFGSNALGLGAALISGHILLRYNGLKLIGWMSLATAIIFLGTAICVNQWQNAPFAIFISLIYMALGYAFIAPLKALSLWLSQQIGDSHTAASRVSMLASIDLTLSLLTASMAGSIVTFIGLSAFFGLAFLLSLFAMVLVFLNPAKNLAALYSCLTRSL